ncbi:MAG: hypothetical protein RL398_714, partial [Planctomycetota bacterium]
MSKSKPIATSLVVDDHSLIEPNMQPTKNALSSPSATARMRQSRSQWILAAAAMLAACSTGSHHTAQATASGGCPITGMGASAQQAPQKPSTA